MLTRITQKKTKYRQFFYLKTENSTRIRKIDKKKWLSSSHYQQYSAEFFDLKYFHLFLNIFSQHLL